MSGFSKVLDTTSYTMQQHLADVDPHPQYVRNDASVIAEILNNYLDDNPIQVSGSLNDLSNVQITNPANGDLLSYDTSTGKWINKAVSDIGIREVRVNGSDVVSNKIATIPQATASIYGVVRFANASEVAAGTAQNVSVTPANVNTMLSNYKASSPGSVTVFITGMTGAKWKIDDGAWNDSGAIVSGLIAGIHTVSFVPGGTDYKTPANVEVNVIGGCIVSFHQEYLYQKCSLTVTISNGDLNSKWLLDGGSTEYASGDTVSNLTEGVHEVALKENNSYNSFKPVKVTLVAGGELSATVAYPAASSELTVRIENAPHDPHYPQPSAPKWKLDSETGYTHVSGETVIVTPGNHTVSFEPYEGYTTPSTQTVTAVRNGKLFVIASYHDSNELIYGVRYIKGTHHPSPKLDGVILDRDTGVKQIVPHANGWPISTGNTAGFLPAHDFHKCVVNPKASNKVAYYLDPADSNYRFNGTYRGITSSHVASNLTGTGTDNGEVMVEILPVYFRVDYVGTDSTGDEIYDWLISRVQFEGSTLHPYFRVGHELYPHQESAAFTQYLGAYESVLANWNPSTEAAGAGYSTTGATEPVSYTANPSCCRSIKGFKPVTNMTLAQFREAHVRTGLHTMNSLAMQFLALMMFIEYRSLDSQDSGVVNFDTDRGCAGNRSDGFVWYNDTFQYAFVRDTGRADSFGNGTGEVVWAQNIDCNTGLPDNFHPSATLGKKVVGFTYRGIENPFGHIFKFEDGILTDANGYYYTTNTSDYTSDIEVARAKYTAVSHPWPGSGFIKFFTFTQEQPTFFATEVGGSSATYLPDFFYGDRLEPRYLRPMGSALGRYTNHAPLDNAGFPKRTGICYRDASNVTATYITNGSRSAFSMPYSE